jgi:catechol 2,3-dioxygenase-like lactoylglutathione lyase family enzyme
VSGAHLHSVGFHVTDLDATTAFYRLLGLAVPSADGAPVAAATVPGPVGTDLTLTWGTSAVLQDLDPGRVADPTLRVQVEIGYDDPAAVDDAWRTATAAGHPGIREPFDTPWGVRFAVLTDPDGNRVACTAPLAATA